MILENNQFKIQGIALTDLVQQFGDPLYVYDANCMESTKLLFDVKTIFPVTLSLIATISAASKVGLVVVVSTC